jgi:thioredoxin-related protein
MKRHNIFFEEEQIKYLKKLPGTVSDHVRIAVMKYIDEIEGKSVSSSESKRGDSND